MYACDSFEGAADYLGRNMAPGTKGATLNAIGSSLPELFTTSILLFGPLVSPELFGDGDDGFSAGIATCAGSAVFNAVIIPALCTLIVVSKGVVQADGSLQQMPNIPLNRRVILRDGFFFVAAQILLIYCLADSTMTWWMGAALTAVYVVYITFTLKSGEGTCAPDSSDQTPETGSVGLLGLGWLLDFNRRLFQGAPFSDKSGWTVLVAATSVIALACGGIAWAVEHTAQVLDIEPYFTAVILAAAATSVPDTILSMKDAAKGEYDNSISNALGSNIFDICVCLGLPLCIYGLMFGDLSLTSSGTAADVQALQWILLLITAVVLAIFLLGDSVGQIKSAILVAIYILWTVFVIARGQGVQWTQTVIDILPGTSGSQAQVQSHLDVISRAPGDMGQKAPER